MIYVYVPPEKKIAKLKIWGGELWLSWHGMTQHAFKSKVSVGAFLECHCFLHWYYTTALAHVTSQMGLRWCIGHAMTASMRPCVSSSSTRLTCRYRITWGVHPSTGHVQERIGSVSRCVSSTPHYDNCGIQMGVFIMKLYEHVCVNQVILRSKLSLWVHI